MMSTPLSTVDPEIEKSERNLTILDRIYWAYYINLPFYLMTTGEAFVLHTIMFFFVSFVIYGVVVYLPASSLYLASRIYFYLTGHDLMLALRQYLPVFSKTYLSYVDFPFFNVTGYLEKLIS